MNTEFQDFKKLKKSEKCDDCQSSALSKLEYGKRKINGIMNSLKKPVAKYMPKKSIDSITDYINACSRILYSEITHCVYSLSEQERATVETNLDCLLNFVTDSNNAISPTIVNAVTKIWDHFNLACYQMDNSQSMLLKDAEKTQSTLYQRLYERFKSIEREHTTILGIFASIILAFVGGMAFSTSVLENINGVGIYRLILVILLLGFVVLNTINILLRYIFKINDKDIKVPIWPINAIIGALAAIVVVCWIFSAHDIPAYIAPYLPW